jgi:hypothetical protein
VQAGEITPNKTRESVGLEPIPLRVTSALDFDEQITSTLRLRITRHAAGKEDRASVPGAVVFRMAAGKFYDYLITVYEANASAETSPETFAEMIRAADALYRLAGVK